MENPPTTAVPIAHQRSRFAPPGHVTLLEALNIVGKRLDASWTGVEPLAPRFAERSIEDLNQQAAAIFQREFLSDPSSSRHEDEIRSVVHAQYARDTAPRVRRQAIVELLRVLLVSGNLRAVADAASGEVLDIPAHVWRADGAEEIFDTGLVWVSGGVATFRKGLSRGENTGLALIRDEDLRDLGDRSQNAKSAAGLLVPAEPNPHKSGYSGRPSIKDFVEQEFRRRAKATEHGLSLRAEAEALSAWAFQTYGRRVTIKTIENQIRHLYNALVRIKPPK